MMYELTEEEWECVRVCVSNAPIPYDITKKKIPADILVKIGQPIRKREEGIFSPQRGFSRNARIFGRKGL